MVRGSERRDVVMSETHRSFSMSVKERRYFAFSAQRDGFFSFLVDWFGLVLYWFLSPELRFGQIRLLNRSEGRAGASCHLQK